MILAGAIGLRADTAEAKDLEKRSRLPNDAYEYWQRAARNRSRTPPARYVSPSHSLPGWLLLPRHCPGADELQTQDRRTLPDHRGERRLLWALRDYQQDALESWQAVHGDGIIEAPCGAGKTVIGCAALCAVQTPALILVHTRDLASQWIERLSQACEALDIGEIRAGKDDRNADVIVATLQTLARWDWPDLVAFGRTRGLVIVDEAHHIPAETFGRVMLAMPARYRLGLTATPERADGLSPIMRWTLGQIVAQISHTALAAHGHVLAPEIVLLTTYFETHETEPHAKRRALAEDTRRNDTIMTFARFQAKKQRRVLILVDLVDHARALAAALAVQGYRAEALIGKMTASQREKCLAELRSGQLSIVVATSIADEGLDVPELSCVILACPSGNVGRVEQRIGRALRPLDGKLSPIVYDLVDPQWQAQAAKRKRLYKARNWKTREQT